MNTKRYVWIDVLRAFAILCVVLCHSVEYSYKFYNADYMSSLSLKSEFFGLTLFTLGRFGVPIFLFITGYLILCRKFDTESTVKFWKKNWFPLLVTIEIWIVIYAIFVYFTKDTNITFWGLLKDILFLDGSAYNHMWYAYMIIGIYPFLPFVSTILDKFDTKIILIPLTVCFGYLFVVPLASTLFVSFGKSAIYNQLDLSYIGGVYGIYLIVGFLLKKDYLKKIHTGIILLLEIISFAATVFVQFYFYENGSAHPVFYSSCLLFASGLFAFELGSRIKYVPFEKIWLSISKCSFGIFLIHNPIKDIVFKIISCKYSSPAITTLITFVFTFIISWIIVESVSRIPFLRKLLFNIK